MVGLVMRLVLVGVMGTVRFTGVLTATAVALPAALLLLGAGCACAREVSPAPFRKAAFGFIVAVGAFTLLMTVVAG